MRDMPRMTISPWYGSNSSGKRGSTGSVSYALAEHLAFAFRYGRLHQIGQGNLLPNRLADHDQFSVSLAYEFARPMGR